MRGEGVGQDKLSERVQVHTLSKGHLSQEALSDGSAPDGGLQPLPHRTSCYGLLICAPSYWNSAQNRCMLSEGVFTSSRVTFL